MDLVQRLRLQCAGLRVIVELARLTDQEGCESAIPSVIDVCLMSDEYDMATIHLAELPSEAGTGAHAPGGWFGTGLSVVYYYAAADKRR